MNGLKGDPAVEDEDEESEQELVIEQHNATLLAIMELQDKPKEALRQFQEKESAGNVLMP